MADFELWLLCQQKTCYLPAMAISVPITGTGYISEHLASYFRVLCARDLTFCYSIESNSYLFCSYFGIILVFLSVTKETKLSSYISLLTRILIFYTPLWYVALNADEKCCNEEISILFFISLRYRLLYVLIPKN